MIKVQRLLLLVLIVALALLTMTGCSSNDEKMVTATVEQFWLGWSESDPNVLDGLFDDIVYLDNTPPLVRAQLAMTLGDPTFWDYYFDAGAVVKKSFVAEEPAMIDGYDVASVKAKMIGRDDADVILVTLDLELRLAKINDKWLILVINGLTTD